MRVTPLTKLRVPLGGQEIELQQIDYADPDAPPQGSAPLALLRTRIREKSRFTIFEVDPQTAGAWGQALLDWAKSQGAEP